ncbi:hypothetical protein [Castellaniella sp.]|uniref:hypothetical protein n=1 Tax=Castellaniella sp. TaxID=1955812 RepID=UPI003A8D7EE1
MQKIDNSQTQNEFVALVGEIQARVTRLQGAIDNHFDLDPEDIHWGHVGDLTQYLEVLTNLTDRIFNEAK